jgi:Mrp family chromosome partitioning ATPase
MVVAVALLTAAAAVGYTLMSPEIYRASASVTVPPELSIEGQASEQYLDSQVLLLESQDVAERAADIANRELGGEVLTTADFSGDGKSLEIIPPEGANPGSYGANTIDVAFTWPSNVVAQAGANAALRAFDEARTDAIRAHGEAVIAGIEQAFLDPRARDQIADLVNQRSDVLVNMQVDLASRPTIAWAVLPEIPINGNSRVAGAVGLILGAVLGTALAFARVTRRRRFDDGGGPAALYRAPLISEVPPSASEKWRFRGGPESPSLPVVAAPQSAVAEKFRLAAASVERVGAGEDRARSLVFVSPDASTGRSVVVANLALALAEAGTRVLAIDSDRTGELTSLLLPDNPHPDGIAQALTGERPVQDCLQPSPRNEALTVLGTGWVPGRRLIGAPYARALGQLLADVTSRFDVVLIDSPPLLQSADGPTLVDAADGVVVVVGTRDLVRDHIQVVERLESSETDVVGYIFNRQNVRPVPRRNADASSVVENAAKLNGNLQQARQ